MRVRERDRGDRVKREKKECMSDRQAGVAADRAGAVCVYCGCVYA